MIRKNRSGASVINTHQLFSLIGENTKNIFDIESYLHPLIHPLSHYEEAQIYRSELFAVEEAVKGLMGQIATFNKKCCLLLGKGNDICIQYNNTDGTYRSNYFVRLDDNLWLYKDKAGNVALTDCKCKMIYMEGVENGTPLKPFNPSGNTRFKYVSLDEALQQIYDYEVNTKHHDVVAGKDYDIVFLSKEMKATKCIQVKMNALLSKM